VSEQSPIADDRLRSELLRLDVLLRRKQQWWEHPRNAAVVLGVFAALVAAVAGVTGFRLGASPPAPIVVQFGSEPLHVRVDH
jgi:hypothetical protein